MVKAERPVAKRDGNRQQSCWVLRLTGGSGCAQMGLTHMAAMKTTKPESRARCTEQCHEAVAEELIDGGFVSMNLGQRPLAESVQQTMHALRAQPLCQGVESARSQKRRVTCLRSPSSAALAVRILSAWCAGV